MSQNSFKRLTKVQIEILSLLAQDKIMTITKVVTVCDRESDFYDFFRAAEQTDAPVLVRAFQNRTVNRNSRYAEREVAKLWDHMALQPDAGTYTVDISGKEKTKHCKGRPPRAALMNVKFGLRSLSGYNGRSGFSITLTRR